MMRSRLLILTSALLLLLNAGCSSGPARDVGLDKLSPRKAEQELSTGITNYEDGNYKAAAKTLQSALDSGLTFDSDAARAHKYLAFIHCLSNREKQCRDEFRKALEKDNKFDLNPAEVGHPIWGPVFRAVKAERKK
ncbi:MAG: TssQ family T6SS-associated lipoprotein [Gammaproteobacteria bacterium]|nr:TssQ family T6SS-associated lipoprotein [Gammaproteobacteria bacterium]MBU1980363.1 TssQ family T6SS-associated lipoprotein [Gammaproteobacteria bacterium]